MLSKERHQTATGPITLADNAGRFAVDPHQRIQFTGDTRTRDAGVGHEVQVFTAAIIIHCQNSELARRTNVSDKKSSDQRWPGRSATGIGVRDPCARFRPLRRLTPSLSSVYSRYSFL